MIVWVNAVRAEFFLQCIKCRMLFSALDSRYISPNKINSTICITPRIGSQIHLDLEDYIYHPMLNLPHKQDIHIRIVGILAHFC